MYLTIDPSTKDRIRLTLFNEVDVKRYEMAGRNRELLQLIDSFFSKENFNKEKLAGIAVVVGEGSFTSTRIACVVANTFGYVYGLPLLAVTKPQAGEPQTLIAKFKKASPGVYISAAYSAEPNIRLPGKRL